ncbi:MAG: carotenoid biosynthesis protein [Anaerolineales bacterium]|nr:carotenoid biosynthesis protein [Anaerolineales bacterium]
MQIPRLLKPNILLALWILTMIALPVVRRVVGDAALVGGVTAGVAMQALAVLAILLRAWGWKRTLFIALGIALLGWLAEFIGSRTGFPFGAYHYTALLQPQVWGVPLVVPLAWLMMLPPAWGIAQAYLQDCPGERTWRGRLAFIGLSALAFTAWDLFLDPQMISWGFWAWQNPGGYFGIPWGNFLGWIMVSALITALLARRDLPLGPLAAVYTITWALQSIGQAFFWGLPGPALVGFLVMGAIVFLGLGKLAGRIKTTSP